MLSVKNALAKLYNYVIKGNRLVEKMRKVKSFVQFAITLWENAS